MSHNYNVAIIGAGASGLMCACSLASLGVTDIAVIERNDKLGRKLLMTGNGRCNVTNDSIVSSDYNCDDHSKLDTILSCYDSSYTREFFEKDLKVKLINKGDLVYPRTLRSETVLQSLKNYCEDNGVSFITDTCVKSITPELTVSDNISAKFIVIATGGASYPATGSDGNSYKLVNSVIHDNSAFAQICPALVQLKSSDKDIKKLSGSKAQVKVKLFINKEEKASECGELLFTDYGVSGICILQLSSIYNRAKLKGIKEAYISVDFLPELSDDESYDQIALRLEADSNRSDAEKISGLISRDIAEVIVSRKGSVFDNIKNFRINISDSMDFDRAQVTSGGVKLSSLKTSLALINKPSVYVIGEAVNVDGPCGGYNLQWAWSSAFAASGDIAGRL